MKEIQLNLFEPVSIKEVYLIVLDSPRGTFYNIRLEVYGGKYIVKKESGTKGGVWDRRSWTFDSFENADKYFKRRIKEKTVRPGKVAYFSGWEARPGRLASHRVASPWIDGSNP